MFRNSYYGADPIGTRNSREFAVISKNSEYALKYGTCSEVYFATEPKYRYFTSENGLVIYKQRGHHIFAIGGLISHTTKRLLLYDMLEWVEENRYRVSFFNVPSEDLAIFDEVGFSFNKWGEEAMIDLLTWTPSGKEFEWVRRQRNYCLRHGLVMEEVRPTESLLDEMDEICRASLADKAQRKEWGLLQSSTDPMMWGQRRLFITRKDGRLEGFLLALPFNGAKGWMFDIFRHREDAVRGVVPFLMMEAMTKLKGDGATTVSLALVPGRGCNGMVKNKILRFLLEKVAYSIPFIFDTAGIDHFKSRFRPRFEDRWICSYPNVSISGIISVVREIGLFNVHFWKLMHILRRQRLIRAKRANLDV